MLNAPACNPRLDRPHQSFTVVRPLFVQGNFFGGWRSKMLTMMALSRFLSGVDETRQFVHPAVLRSTV